MKHDIREQVLSLFGLPADHRFFGVETRKRKERERQERSIYEVFHMHDDDETADPDGYPTKENTARILSETLWAAPSLAHNPLEANHLGGAHLQSRNPSKCRECQPANACSPRPDSLGDILQAPDDLLCMVGSESSPTAKAIQLSLGRVPAS